MINRCQQASEKMLNKLIIREMQIKTTICHLTPIRMATIYAHTHTHAHTTTKVTARMWRNWDTCKLLVGM